MLPADHRSQGAAGSARARRHHARGLRAQRGSRAGDAELAAAIGYHGIIDIGWRFDARDGSYKMLDLNPRLGATFRLFVGADGMDVVRALHLDMTGRPIPTDRAVEGRKWMTEFHDLRTSAILARRGDLSAGQWVRTVSGVSETAWIAHLTSALLSAFVALRMAARVSPAARRDGAARPSRPRPRRASPAPTAGKELSTRALGSPISFC